MSVWDKLKGAFAPKNASLDSVVYGADFYSAVGAAGVSVNERTAMNASAVYACINLIGGAIAGMPIHIYQRGKDGRERVDHDLWWLLNEQPIPRMSAATFWEYIMTSRLLHGDAFARIIRASEFSPKITGFEPLHPSAVDVQLIDNRLVYTITGRDKKITVDQDDMLHFTGAGFDGLRSMSQIKYSLQTAVGVALAAGEYSAGFFKNSARPDFAIEIATNPTVDQQEMMRRTFTDRHGGPGQSSKPMLLVGGAKIQPLSMNADDAQLIQTRMFQIEDIARIFGVPAFMIGHTEKTTSWGSGVEQMSIGFVKYTLATHLNKIENEINRKCFRIARNFAEFSTAGLERGDIKTRSEAYRIGLGRAGEPGWLTQNEVRGWENLPRMAEGDELMNGGQNAFNEPA